MLFEDKKLFFVTLFENNNLVFVTKLVFATLIENNRLVFVTLIKKKTNGSWCPLLQVTN